MFWYDHDGGGWGWFAMSAGMILFWILIVAVGVLVYRAVAGSRRDGALPRAQPPGPPPEQLLAERFARGEIDEDEYHRRLTVLRESAGGVPRPGRR
ncbi:hypothetical protein GCM10010503_18090 [Streptomyces lucensis JCM 4490]|uniref:SHOCT domain-containing protein n=1 Tax=Streptomyces lucensis JCM 4490 TaxID=1306176 RepID=A0A918MPP9_9ACTN|nr:SHOCT domain-containing protein [Streptomyces lucensis]GGW42139.1 hypothetical protein GCM10010503_18090 [Streptomyces lucensis JCM 4490]